MLKKSAKLLILLLVAIPGMLMAQTNNFEFIQYDVDHVGSEDFIVLHGDIFNLSDAAFDLTVTRVTHSAPPAWSTSFCVGPACLPDFLDNFTFDFSAGDTALFSLDTYPSRYVETYPDGVLGVGSWTIYAVDSLTMEIDSVQITMEVVALGTEKEFQSPLGFELSTIFPNPTNASINFNLDVVSAGMYSIVLYSLDGREIATRNYDLRSGKNLIQWGMRGLASGNYIISASANGRTHSRQVSVIK